MYSYNPTVVKSVIHTNGIAELLTKNYANKFPADETLETHPAVDVNLLLCGVNDTYQIKWGNKKFIYRVYTHHWKTKEFILSEINLINELRNLRVSAHYPLTDNNDKWITQINTPEGIRYGVLFSYVEGRNAHLINREVAKEIGTRLANLHYELSFIKKYSLPFINSEKLLEEPHKKILNILPALEFANRKDCRNEVRTKLETCFSKLTNLPYYNLSSEPAFGICHGDTHLGNIILCNDGEPCFIDFDLIAYGPRAYDLATFIWKLELIPAYKETKLELSQAFIEGYESIRTLSKEEKTNIGTLIAWRYYYWLGAQSQLIPNLIGMIHFNQTFFETHLNWLENWCDYGLKKFHLNQEKSASLVHKKFDDLPSLYLYQWMESYQNNLLLLLKREYSLGTYDRAKYLIQYFSRYVHYVSGNALEFSNVLKKLMPEMLLPSLDDPNYTEMNYRN